MGEGPQGCAPGGSTAEGAVVSLVRSRMTESPRCRELLTEYFKPLNALFERYCVVDDKDVAVQLSAIRAIGKLESDDSALAERLVKFLLNFL